MARSQVATPSHLIHADAYSGLVANGFRRSGMFTYRPYCDGCRACVPLRVPVQRLHAHPQPAPRLEARTATWRRACCACASCPSTTSSTCATSPAATAAAAWTTTASTSTPSSCCKAASTRAWSSSASRRPTAAGALKMVSILDVLNDGLSAVYTFYEPEPEASYGTYSVLWQIEQTRMLQAAARLPRLLDRQQQQDGLQGAVRAARTAGRRALGGGRQRRRRTIADEGLTQALRRTAPLGRKIRRP